MYLQSKNKSWDSEGSTSRVKRFCEEINTNICTNIFESMKLSLDTVSWSIIEGRHSKRVNRRPEIKSYSGEAELHAREYGVRTELKVHARWASARVCRLTVEALAGGRPEQLRCHLIRLAGLQRAAHVGQRALPKRAHVDALVAAVCRSVRVRWLRRLLSGTQHFEIAATQL